MSMRMMNRSSDKKRAPKRSFLCFSRGENTFYGVDYRLSLRVELDVHVVTHLFVAKQRTLHCFWNEMDVKAVGFDFADSQRAAV